MTEEEMRLACLQIAADKVDADAVLDYASVFWAFVDGSLDEPEEDDGGGIDLDDFDPMIYIKNVHHRLADEDEVVAC